MLKKTRKTILIINQMNELRTNDLKTKIKIEQYDNHE